MKKKDIIKIITLKRELDRNIEIARIINETRGSISNKWDLLDIEMGEFPDIEEVNEEVEIIKNEIVKSLEVIPYLREEISKIPCLHEIRLSTFNGFCSDNTCLFCGKQFSEASNGNTIYNDVNRNKNCVKLDCFDEEYKTKGYSDKQVYEIIENIIKDKDDDEDVDLISEFKKLHLEYCDINEEKKVKEYYVLVVGGSNIYDLTKNAYITSKANIDSISIAKYFLGIHSFNVELFDSEYDIESTTFSDVFSNSNISRFIYKKYRTIDELEKMIKEEGLVPFDLIIDLSNLNLYKTGQKINIKKYDLNLKERFKDSIVITIPDIKSFTKNRKLKLFKDQLSKVDDTYGYDTLYSHLEDDEIKEYNQKDICLKIKKMVLKR